MKTPDESKPHLAAPLGANEAGGPPIPMSGAVDESIPAMVDPGTRSIDWQDHGARYTRLRTLGQGGMGLVELCRDHHIGRDVALKVLLPDRAPNAQARARFLREARIQGQLEHPSIVPVYDLEVEPGGVASFTMKYLRGMTLSQILQDLRKGAPDAVRAYPRHRLLGAFSALCLAVDFAHSRGVVHRDLKPSNVMLGSYGELYVLDWGVAKVVQEAPSPAPEPTPDDAVADADMTGHGEMLGTVGYMSPEQCRGRNAELTPRSDVYSLGAILFEILTLTPLHERTTRMAMIYEAVHGVVAETSVRAPESAVPPELEAICVKATRLKPEDRHASARALQEEIERFLEGDRDMDLRRKMASRHAEEARRLCESDIDTGDARRRALQEVGRALALDPTNAAAMRMLAQVLTTLPARVPEEVKAELAAAAVQGDRRSLFIWAAGELLGLPLTMAITLWMGVRSVPVWVAMVGFTLASIVVKLLAMNARRAHIEPYLYTAYLLNMLAFIAFSRAGGPFIIIPTLLSMWAMTYCARSSPRSPKLVIAMTCLVQVAAVAAGQLGILPPSSSFHDGAMTILPRMVSLPEVPTLSGLSLSAVTLIAIPPYLMLRGQDAYREAQERIALHAWHLRQLLPAEAPSQGNGALEA